MAYVLVKWIDEDKSSVILSAWVIQPNPIGDLPATGKCIWKKKGSSYKSIILLKSGTYFLFLVIIIDIIVILSQILSRI